MTYCALRKSVTFRQEVSHNININMAFLWLSDKCVNVAAQTTETDIITRPSLRTLCNTLLPFCSIIRLSALTLASDAIIQP